MAKRGRDEDADTLGRNHGFARTDSRDEARRRLASNPFYVLGLRPDCARAEVEREGQKLLGMLELELSAAASYRSPLGVHRRTPELVREAMAALRDPDRRLLHEVWAALAPDDPALAGASPEEVSEARESPDLDVDVDGFPGLTVLGFGRGSSR